MTDKIDNISDELLAVFLDGNTTTMETELVLEAIINNDEVREVVHIANEVVEEVGFWYRYAASMFENNKFCCILSEKYILHKKGIDVPERTLVDIAKKNGWFDSEKGTPSIHIGKLLEFYGIPVSRKMGVCAKDLLDELLAGQFVIAYIDGGELTGDLEAEKIEDAVVGESPDHVVIVVGMNIMNGSQTITLYDVTTEDEFDNYTIEQFMDSWADSKFYMVSTK